jgi:hypothetical protein
MRHNENWLRAVSKPRPQHVKDAVSRAQKGRVHKAHEGFQVGHESISGTENTRFKVGQPNPRKGTGIGKDRFKLKYRTYRAGAKQRGFTFDVTLEDFKRMVSGTCVYCGESATGIDRVDNNLGYVEGNMASCCFTCNKMKGTMSKETFLGRCKKILTCIGYEV